MYLKEYFHSLLVYTELLIQLLEKESVSKSKAIPRLEPVLREQLELVRLGDALSTEFVTSDRGSSRSNRDNIVLRLDVGGKLNYCITPQPIHRSRLTAAVSFLSSIASIWHRSIQVSHAVQFSGSPAA